MSNYEDGNSYEEIMERSLAKVSTDVDKREGSVIWNAMAPTNEEIATLYILLDAIYENGFADTAEREYLILRCKERGITPEPATYAVLKGEFNMEIPIGNRFNLGDLNYVVIAFINSSDDKYYYQLQCETLGTEGNVQFGELSAIDFVDTNMEGSITELLIPAEDEEDTEVLRQRYMDSFTTTPFGGNQDDYRSEVGKLDGVGGVKIIPVWNGGGTVKIIIINSSFDKASSTLVDKVQEAVDPNPQGTGAGIAPIGHTVTVVSCVDKAVNVTMSCTFEDGYSWSTVQELVKTAISDYLLEIRKNWASLSSSIVRISQVENRILNIDGIIDIRNTKINGSTENLTLEFEEIPVLGRVENA